MLANLRFVIGAALATALLAVTALGLFAAVRMTHHTKIGPLESSRSMAFDDRTDWNQFNDPESARRFEELTRKAAAAAAAAARAADASNEAAPPAAAPEAVAQRPPYGPADPSPNAMAASGTLERIEQPATPPTAPAATAGAATERVPDKTVDAVERVTGRRTSRPGLITRTKRRPRTHQRQVRPRP